MIVIKEATVHRCGQGSALWKVKKASLKISHTHAILFIELKTTKNNSRTTYGNSKLCGGASSWGQVKALGGGRVLPACVQVAHRRMMQVRDNYRVPEPFGVVERFRDFSAREF
jgi:hypothetical protein